MIVMYATESLAPPDEGGLFTDHEFERLLSKFEHSTYSLAFAGVDAPGHALMDMKSYSFGLIGLASCVDILDLVQGLRSCANR